MSVTVLIFVNHTPTFSQLTEVRFFVSLQEPHGNARQGDAFCQSPDTIAHDHTLDGLCFMWATSLYVAREHARRQLAVQRADHVESPFLGEVHVVDLTGR